MDSRARGWMRLLESLRRRRGAPEDRLAEIGVAKGMRVADIGAGYGFFALPAAEAVGEEGLVYAVEPEPKRAAAIAERADRGGLKNVRVVVRGAEDVPEIATGDLDVAISMSSFHHFTDKGKALDELGRIVRPGGLIYVRDIKAGRVFRHGSGTVEFEATVRSRFSGAEFEVGRGYVEAKVRV